MYCRLDHMEAEKLCNEVEILKLIEKVNGYAVFLMKNKNVALRVSNLGCQILSIYIKDKNGNWDDIVLGAEKPEGCAKDSAYMGAVIGRVANRIKGASFVLNRRIYLLAKNNGPNHLHGGEKGFNQKFFSYRLLDNGIEFSYVSANMEEGYPGCLTLKVTYRLKHNELFIHYHAVSDEDTLANFTNHTYFNLSGCKENILGHALYINSDYFMGVDQNGMVTGEFLPVKNTPFDFRVPSIIGDNIGKEHQQLKLAKGYDHSFLLKGKARQIVLSHMESGREVTITTDMPMVQVYTGNYLSGGAVGKCGLHYKDWDGIALETQLCPDSIHIEENPSVILRKNKVYQSTTCYRFEVKQ